MAFSKGTETTEGLDIKRYIGVAPCFVVAVNPDEKKASEILGYNTKITPYVSEVEVNGKKVKNVRIDFYVKTDAEKVGVEVTGKLTYFLQRLPRIGSQSGKYQIIDEYGRTAWATAADITNKSIPVYSNGPANITANYRKAYTGEEEITGFLINYLVIPNVQKWNATTKRYEGMIDDPSLAEARLDKIEDFFNGNFKELETILSYHPTNKIKLLWGVKTNEDNKMFQVIYSRTTIPNRVTDYSKLAVEIADRYNSGGLKNIEYKVCDFQEYVVQPTDFSQKEENDAFDDWA